MLNHAEKYKPYVKTCMNKYSIEDKLYQSVDQFNERKISIEIFMQNFLIIYTHFMTRMGEHVRYHLLAAGFYIQ